MARDPSFEALYGFQDRALALMGEIDTMVNDVPSHLGKVTVHPVLGRLDSAENILANKLSALVDREEPKDHLAEHLLLLPNVAE